ncbi:RNase H domain-containing protein [Caerostris darwini]|uniref:RNase H domain-containing protein n=1 Tax=Caerostris darwini TaxID=1538125 RepID=A0AAV4MWE9_9ARAC|nr:RNase H domain-containing protein [Caerostris darwini]
MVSPNAGAGVFSDIFSFYVPVGRGTAFDGEIAAIRTTLSQLQCHLESTSVILCDSRSALLAIVSNNIPKPQDTLDCRYHLENLASLKKTIVVQWVPAHCGVPGNEKADFLAKRGGL